uniref:Receptor activity-modifying protein 1 n=1 Tax=Sinocyclocheilus grahami TaxID=75366 RepID=A0A672KDQ6_SINGR
IKKKENSHTSHLNHFLVILTPLKTGMNCFWPNRMVDEFFIRVHRHYFHDCSMSGRLLHDPPNRILGPFIVVPILVTLLMTALVVWRSKRSEGII